MKFGNFILKPLIALSAIIIILSGKNLKAEISDFNFGNEEGIVSISSLMNAAINNDIEGVKFFVKAGSDIVNQKNLGGATPLHLAARSGNVEVAEILIQNGANINATDNESWTPLMRAATAKNPQIISLLIDKGADARKFNIFHETAIINSADSECLECFNILFTKYDFRKMDLQTLKDQINEAFKIVRNKNNTDIQLVLSTYLESLNDNSKVIDPAAINDNNNFVAEDLDGKKSKAVKNSSKGYRFKGEIKSNVGKKINTPNNISKKSTKKMIIKKEPVVEPLIDKSVTIIPEVKNNNDKKISVLGNVSKESIMKKSEILTIPEVKKDNDKKIKVLSNIPKKSVVELQPVVPNKVNGNKKYILEKTDDNSDQAVKYKIKTPGL